MGKQQHYYSIQPTYRCDERVIKNQSPRHAVRQYEEGIFGTGYRTPICRIVETDEANARWIVQRVRYSPEPMVHWECLGKVRYYTFKDS